MSSEMTIYEKYKKFGMIMATLLILEVLLPYKMAFLNVVFYGIVFAKMILCRCMEYAFSKEVKKGNNYKKCKLIYEIQTYFYLVIFILDIQTSFKLSASEDYAAVVYLFFTTMWILQFVFSFAGLYFFIKANDRSKTDWIVINIAFLGMLGFNFFKGLSENDMSAVAVTITLILVVWRVGLWLRYTSPLQDKEVREEYM